MEPTSTKMTAGTTTNCRLIELRQNEATGKLGFSLRGGKEATGSSVGVFVSHVELTGQANRNGLRIGDQLIQVNGLQVSRATYDEVIELIKRTPRSEQISLLVSYAGRIPFQEKSGEPIKWLHISPPDERRDNKRGARGPETATATGRRPLKSNSYQDDSAASSQSLTFTCSSASSSSSSKHEDEDEEEISNVSSSTASSSSSGCCLSVSSDFVCDAAAKPPATSTETEVRVPGGLRTSQPFGCGVVKGPDEWPGIFVQHVKPGSLAERVRLEPGDQLLRAEHFDLAELTFERAISLIKRLQAQQDTLVLRVRKGAALEHLARCKRYPSGEKGSLPARVARRSLELPPAPPTSEEATTTETNQSATRETQRAASLASGGDNSISATAPPEEPAERNNGAERHKEDVVEAAQSSGSFESVERGRRVPETQAPDRAPIIQSRRSPATRSADLSSEPTRPLCQSMRTSEVFENDDDDDDDDGNDAMRLATGAAERNQSAPVPEDPRQQRRRRRDCLEQRRKDCHDREDDHSDGEPSERIRIVRQNCKLHHHSMHSLVKSSPFVSERLNLGQTTTATADKRSGCSARHPLGGAPLRAIQEHKARPQLAPLQRYTSMDNLPASQTRLLTCTPMLQQQRQQQQQRLRIAASQAGKSAAPRHLYRRSNSVLSSASVVCCELAHVGRSDPRFEPAGGQLVGNDLHATQRQSSFSQIGMPPPTQPSNGEPGLVGQTAATCHTCLAKSLLAARTAAPTHLRAPTSANSTMRHFQAHASQKALSNRFKKQCNTLALSKFKARSEDKLNTLMNINLNYVNISHHHQQLQLQQRAPTMATHYATSRCASPRPSARLQPITCTACCRETDCRSAVGPMVPQRQPVYSYATTTGTILGQLKPWRHELCAPSSQRLSPARSCCTMDALESLRARPARAAPCAGAPSACYCHERQSNARAKLATAASRTGASTDSSGYQSGCERRRACPAASHANGAGQRPDKFVSGAQRDTSQRLSTFSPRVARQSEAQPAIGPTPPASLSDSTSGCSPPSSLASSCSAEYRGERHAPRRTRDEPNSSTISISSISLSPSSHSTETSRSSSPASRTFVVPTSQQIKSGRKALHAKGKAMAPAASGAGQLIPCPPPMPLVDADQTLVRPSQASAAKQKKAPVATPGAGESRSNRLCFVDELKMLASGADSRAGSARQTDSQGQVDSATLIKTINANKSAAKSATSCCLSAGVCCYKSGGGGGAKKPAPCRLTTDQPSKSVQLRDEEDNKRRQHELLMEEFKTAHSKMFNKLRQTATTSNGNTGGDSAASQLNTDKDDERGKRQTPTRNASNDLKSSANIIMIRPRASLAS